MRVVFRAFIAYSAVEMRFVLWTVMTSTIFILEFEIFRATAGTDEWVPYFRTYAIGAITVRIQLIWEQALAFLAGFGPNQIRTALTSLQNFVPFARSQTFLTDSLSVEIRSNSIAYTCFFI